jgi:hypothetical protein
MRKINPLKVTNFKRTQHALEYFWFYSIICAGKSSDWASKKTDEIFAKKPAYVSPLDWISDGRRLHKILLSHSIGQYNRISKCIRESTNVNLNCASVDELFKIHGIGRKTARFFILHSREDANCIPLDIHILKWLKMHRVRCVPKDTPASGKEYDRLERAALRLLKTHFPDKSIAEADLHIWSVVSGRVESENNNAFPKLETV